MTEELKAIKNRYKPNPSFDGRKERDGFVCGKPTGSNWCFCVAVKRGDLVQVRDTKDPADTTLSFSKDEWQAFITAVKDGEFDV